MRVFTHFFWNMWCRIVVTSSYNFGRNLQWNNLSLPYSLWEDIHSVIDTGIFRLSISLWVSFVHFFLSRHWPIWASVSSVQSFSCVQLFATPWTAACQASLSISNSWSFLNHMSIELVMPSNYIILCCLLLLLPSIFPSIRAFSNESVLHIRWPKYGVSASV